jgi:hypothetical protein
VTVRLLSDEMRECLLETGDPDGPTVRDATFWEAIERGWGFWGREFWEVTPEGRAARERDTAARKALGLP